MKFWFGIVDSISSAVTPLFQRLYSTNVSLGDNATYTRSTDGTLVDFEGLVKTMPDNCARMQGARIVENLLPDYDISTGWTTGSVSITTGISDPDGGNNAFRVTATGTNGFVYRGLTFNTARNSLWIRRNTGTGDIKVYKGPGSTNNTVTVDGTWQRFAADASVVNGSGRCGFLIATSGDIIDVYALQAENVAGQSNQNPSEYVSDGVLTSPFHGLGVDGIKAFTTQNGNTVASNVVTEATGSAITGDIGLLVEPAATNLGLYSEDLSNAAWVATNVTKGSTSTTTPDGTDSITVELTASAGNGTVLQTITSASANRSYAVYMKREVGTGNIDLTVDGGSTWTTKTITSSWARYDIQQASVTNPQFGVRIVTSGDSISFWGSQIENQSVPTSYIKTEGATATRNADALSYSGVSTDNETRVVADLTYPFDTFVNNDTDDYDLSAGITEDGMIQSITVYSPGERP